MRGPEKSDYTSILHVLLGPVIWVVGFGYRLRPDNPHQWQALSRQNPELWPPLPWLTTTPHPVFQTLIGLGSPEWMLLGVHLLGLLVLSDAIRRLCRILNPQSFWIHVATLSVFALVGIDGLSHGSWFKGYATPSSLAGPLSIWGMVMGLCGRKSWGASALALSALVHPAWIPVAALGGILVGARRCALMVVPAVLTSLLLTQPWLHLGLDVGRFRETHLWPIRSLTSLQGAFWMAMATVALGSRNHALDRFDSQRSRLTLCVVLAVLAPGIVRLDPWLHLAEILGIAVSFSMFSRWKPWPRITTLLVVLGGAFIMRDNRTAPPLHLGPHIAQEHRPFARWCRQKMPKEAVVWIPPSFTSFRTLARRVPWVDIAAVPWNPRDALEWNRRLAVICQTGRRSPDFDDILGVLRPLTVQDLVRARESGCSHVVWPSPLVGPGLAASIVYQDAWMSVMDAAD